MVPTEGRTNCRTLGRGPAGARQDRKRQFDVLTERLGWLVLSFTSTHLRLGDIRPVVAPSRVPHHLMQPRFGTLDWGQRRNGVLTRAERLHFLSNMALLAVREAIDIIRTTLGVMRRVNLELSDLAPPDTRIVKDAEEYARATHTQDLLSHAYRTYYFGAMLAAYQRLSYDRETHFAAALL